MVKLELSLNTKRALQDAFDTDDEYCLALLVRKEGDRLVTVQFNLSLGEINSTSMQDVMAHYIPRSREEPHIYEVIPGHAHSRAYGHTIEPFDPYWTIAQAEGLVPGSIVDGKFYVTKKLDNGGDSKAFEGLCTSFGRVTKVNINRTLFVHPRYGSEGNPMTRELVQLTAYGFAPASRFKVREIPIEIV